MSLVELAKRHWRFFAPSWLAPVALMLLLVAQDIWGQSWFLTVGFAVLRAPLLIGGTVAVGYLKHREKLFYGVIYLLWLVPTMALWCALVLARAAVMTLLGRPLS